MAELFASDFTGTNGASPPSPLTAYGNVESTWQIQSNGLAQLTEWGPHILAYGATIDDDQWIEVTVTGRAAGGHLTIGVRLDTDDPTDFDPGATIHIDTDGSWYLTAGSGFLTSGSSDTVPYTFRLEAEGTTVRCYKDTNEVYNDTVGGIATSGKPFVGMRDTNLHPNNRFDDMSIGDFEEEGETQVTGTGSLTGGGTLSGAGTVATTVTGTGSLSGGGSLSGTGEPTIPTPDQVTGTGTLVGAGAMTGAGTVLDTAHYIGMRGGF